jgi:hypothetical protein
MINTKEIIKVGVTGLVKDGGSPDDILGDPGGIETILENQFSARTTLLGISATTDPNSGMITLTSTVTQNGDNKTIENLLIDEYIQRGWYIDANIR